jgi:hypothetical protein
LGRKPFREENPPDIKKSDGLNRTGHNPQAPSSETPIRLAEGSLQSK